MRDKTRFNRDLLRKVTERIENRFNKENDDSQSDEVIEHENSRQNPQENSNYYVPYSGKSIIDPSGPNDVFRPNLNSAQGMKEKTKENEAVTQYVNSTIARKNAEGKVSDEYRKNIIRQNLGYRNMEPLPDYLCVSEPFPIDKLPKQSGQFIKSVAQFLQVPIEAVGPALLGAIFIAARGNFKIKVKTDYYEALTAYIVVAAPPSTKKSGIVDILRPIFEIIEGELQAEFNRNFPENKLKRRMIEKYIQSMTNPPRNNKKKGGDDDDDDDDKDLFDPEFILSEMGRKAKKLVPFEEALTSIGHLPRFLTDSPTPKALAVEMKRQNEAIGIFEAEGGIWKHRIRANDDVLFLKGYTMEPFGDETNTGDTVVMQHPCLAICSVMQKGVTEKLFSKTDLTKDGLIPRILPVFPPQIKRMPDPDPENINKEAKAWYENKIRVFLKLTRPDGEENKRTFHTLELASESLALYKEYAYEVNTQIYVGDFKACVEFGGKLAGSAVRLAGAVHLLQHDDPHRHPINLSAMEAGIALAKFFAKHAQVFFDVDKVIGHKYAWKILNWINKHEITSFTVHDFHRYGASHCENVNEIHQGLDLLERHCFLAQYVNSKKQIEAVVHPHFCGNTFSGTQQKLLTLLS